MNQINENNNKLNYEERKRQNDEAAQRAKFRKKVRKIAIWSAVISAVIVGGKYIWKANEEAGRIRRENETVAEVQGEYFKSQGQDHIAIGASHPEYSSNPPTSGWHYENAHATGVYSEEFPDEQLVHNLEHGHIWISYRPDLDKATVEKLNAIKSRFDGKIIIVPRSKNDSPIALAAWEYLLKLDTYDETKILGFIKAHRGKGPEDIPDMGI